MARKPSLPFDRPSPRGPLPRFWFVRLVNAVQDADRRLEREARRQLRLLGIRAIFSRAWRRKPTAGGDPS